MIPECGHSQTLPTVAEIADAIELGIYSPETMLHALARHYNQLERALAAERALADRLAMQLEDIGYYEGFSKPAKGPVTEALNAWKEARK